MENNAHIANKKMKRKRKRVKAGFQDNFRKLTGSMFTQIKQQSTCTQVNERGDKEIW